MTASTASDDASADVLKAARMAIAATQKKDYSTALTLFNQIYGNPAFDAPVDGLSYYGLCVALEEKQTKKGVDLCRKAIELQFYDSTHHANLVRLHMAKKNRKLAVKALEDGLKNLPEDKRLLDLRREIGFRESNPVPFLPRESTLNRTIGTRRRGNDRSPKNDSPARSNRGTSIDLQNLQPLQMILFGLLGFASIFSITFYIMYQQAYG